MARGLVYLRPVTQGFFKVTLLHYQGQSRETGSTGCVRVPKPRIMEEGFVECTLFYCFYEKMAYVTETLKSHLADFTSVSQLVSQNEKVHTRWG